MKDIRIVPLLALVMLITSCGSLRNKSSDKSISHVKQGAKIEQNIEQSSASKATVKEKEIDKGVIVTEKETTTKTTTGGKSKIVLNKGDLKNGDNFLRDSAGNNVKVVLDTLRKALTIEFDIPKTTTETTVKEKTTETKDNTTERKEERKDSTNNKVAIRADTHSEQAITQKSNESTPNLWAIFIDKIGWAIAFLVIVIGVWWWFFGFKRRGK